MIASLLLRKALYDALRAAPTITALLGGPKVYDEPPRTVAFPYMTLGDTQFADYSTATGPGQEHTIVLHVWSREGGQAQAQTIVGEVMQLLESASLALSGHALVNLRFALADIRRESDGRTYHGIIRFRAVTEPVAA
jgi:hypothetical protein